MKIEIVTSIIAFLGVLLSVIIAHLSTKRTIRLEVDKTNKSIEQDYAKQILEKRLNVYPKIYFELSEFMTLIFDHNPTVNELKQFVDNQNSLYSNYGVFLSAETADLHYRLCRYVIDIISKIEAKGNSEIKSEDRKNALRSNIQKVEIGLKKDLGIFIVEFQDGKRTEKIEKNYNSLKQLVDKKNVS